MTAEKQRKMRKVRSQRKKKGSFFITNYEFRVRREREIDQAMKKVPRIARRIFFDYVVY